MALSWQVDKKRQRQLLRELRRIVRLCPLLGFKQLFVCGSLARGEVTASSDLDLVAVQATDLPFLARLDSFYAVVKPRVAVDILIYTPQEMETLRRDRAFIQRILEEARLVYEETPY